MDIIETTTNLDPERWLRQKISDSSSHVMRTTKIPFIVPHNKLVIVFDNINNNLY